MARLQATYLLDKGHRQLAVATSWLSAQKEAHLAAIRQTCAEYGVAPPITFTVPERRAALRQVLTTILSENPAPTAICAADDEIALALLAALADLSITVPDQVAVIGNGNLSLASRTVPALTTVSTDDPTSYIEQLLANILAASRGEPHSDPQPLSYHVVVRKST